MNLQQTNTNGYKFQGSAADLERAKLVVEAWGTDGLTYSTSHEYQTMLQGLRGNFNYRLDTNYAKMDRIGLASLEEFKTRILETEYHGHTIRQWSRILARQNNTLDTELLRLIED
jgi:hypothetical protein